MLGAAMNTRPVMAGLGYQRRPWQRNQASRLSSGTQPRSARAKLTGAGCWGSDTKVVTDSGRSRPDARLCAWATATVTATASATLPIDHMRGVRDVPACRSSGTT